MGKVLKRNLRQEHAPKKRKVHFGGHHFRTIISGPSFLTCEPRAVVSWQESDGW